MEQPKEKDASVVVVQPNIEPTAWTAADESRIRTQIDFRVLPMVFILYLATFIDRANIGNARILGMEEDLHLTGYKFNWILTAYYFAYAASTVPSNLGLRALGGKIWLSFLVVAFGLITTCLAFTKSYGGFLACRIILGAAEGGVLPGLAFYLSLFYRRDELAARVACFMVGASLAGAFGGLLAAGLSQIPPWGASVMVIDRWRNVFFFEGILSILFGFVGILALPSSPELLLSLSVDDRSVAANRILRDNQEHASEKITRRDIIRGIFNINTNICGIGLLCASLSVTALSVFVPTLLHALGWGAVKSNLLSVPPFAVAAAYTMISCYLSDRYKQRGFFNVLGSIFTLTGFAILVSPVSHSIKYMAVFFACCGCFAQGPLFIAWLLNNTAGPTIRAVSVAYMTGCAQIGTLIAVWSYLPQDSPDFIRGHATNVGATSLNIVVSLLGIIYCSWENSVRSRGGRDHRLDGIAKEDEWRLGYRHPRFRYTI